MSTKPNHTKMFPKSRLWDISYDVRKNAREIMKMAIKAGEEMSTGGWQVRIMSGQDHGGKWARIDLAFAIEQTFNEGEEYDEE